MTIYMATPGKKVLTNEIRQLQNNVKQFWKQYRTGWQEDAHEFIVMLL